MDPHHPRQNFNACHPCYPCQNLTHATHKPMPSMPPMNPCYSHHPRYLADSIWNIRTVWQKKLYIRLDIVKNLCLIFRTQNVLILCILLIPLDQIILIAFVNKIYILGISKQFGTKNYACRLDIIQIFMNFCLILLGPKCPNTPMLLLPRGKMPIPPIPPYSILLERSVEL